MSDPRKALDDIFRHALAAVDPYDTVARHADGILSRYELGRYKRLFVLGFGKAVSPMVRAVADRLGGLLTGGVVITKHGYPVEVDGTAGIGVHEAGHPIPDEDGLKATMEFLRLAATFDDETLLVCLISGGGSALLVAPIAGISLAEKQDTTDLLLKAGADIYELNAVRKHVSRVKGGRLAQIAWPASIESLILSDVMGDPLDVIASGPTAPDRTTFGDAMGVIEKFGLGAAVPRSLFQTLRDGAAGRLPETPKEGDPIFEKVRNTIVGNNKGALEAARQRAVRLGFDAAVLSAEVRGEAADAGRWLAHRALAARTGKGGQPGGAPVCFISGGETTVTVKGSGLGGRNMELALAFALAIEGQGGITLLSAGTDGSDGPTDAAGAVVDGNTAREARSAGLEPEAYLANNDSYNFFRKAGGLFFTGPTGTNVMDIQIVLIGT